MNPPARRLLRSTTTASEFQTPKRNLSDESSQLSVKKLKLDKKTKRKINQKEITNSNQRSTDEGVILPSYELLNKASQLENYHRALLLKRDQDEELLNLDQSLSISNSKEKNESSKERLQNIVRWKLLRGQFRATLPALIAQNTSENVDRVIQKALDELASCHTIEAALQSNALQTMCELKGVGPATAAAFLSFEFPKLIPVFSDEAASFFEKQLGSIKYTLGYYKKYVNLMHFKTVEIATLDDTWEINRLERALWTFKLLKKHMPINAWVELMGDTPAHF